MKYPILSDEESRILAGLVQEGDEEARSLMIEENIGLVDAILFINPYNKFKFMESDLRSGGFLGLIRAVELYDGRDSTSFRSFADYWIKQSMNEVIRDTVKVIHIPTWLWKFKSKYEKFRSSFYDEHGYYPSIEQCIDELSVSEKVSAKRIKKNLKALRIFDKFAFNEDLDWVVASTVRRNAGNNIKDFVGKLSKKHKVIIEKSFGFDGEPLSLREIAEQLGTSKSSVHVIYNEAIEQLNYLIKKEKSDG